MRLINVETYMKDGILTFEEFFEADVPAYAILSHRWGSEELSYKEVVKQAKKIDTSRKGYQKVTSACCIVDGHNIGYLWCDTCCINKDSSAELTEAINSMFKWYRDSAFCLAYLADVEPDSLLIIDSEWFTRAWTLQELLAPRNVYFYNADWGGSGTKESRSEEIESITGIPAILLKFLRPLLDYPNAQKMSWAAKRKATREEDIAYSLLGLFDVNMAPLYGEGTKAFMRLQEELMRHSGDPTLLLWEADPVALFEEPHRRLLAKSPSEFAHVSAGPFPPIPESTRLSLTNVELDVAGSLVRWAPETYALVMSKARHGDYTTIYRAILLRQSRESSGLMYRSGTCEWKQNKYTPYPQSHRKFAIAREMRGAHSLAKVSSHFAFKISCKGGIQIQSLSTKYKYSHIAPDPPTNLEGPNCLNHIECTLGDPKQPAVTSIVFTMRSDLQFFVDFTFDFDSYPCILVSRSEPKRSVWRVSETISDAGQIHELKEDPDGHSYFFRYQRRLDDNLDYDLKLPADLIPGHTLWVNFVAPGGILNETGNWFIRFSVDQKWLQWD